MADRNVRRVITAALLAAAPVIGFAGPASAQGSVPWHQSGAGGSLHQSGAGGSLHQGSVPWHQQGTVPWYQGTSGPAAATDTAAFDARF